MCRAARTSAQSAAGADSWISTTAFAFVAFETSAACECRAHTVERARQKVGSWLTSRFPSTSARHGFLFFFFGRFILRPYNFTGAARRNVFSIVVARPADQERLLVRIVEVLDRGHVGLAVLGLREAEYTAELATHP